MDNLNHLKYFYHVAETMSFTEAASELCVTQSAFTKRIQVLEDDCGLKLFGKLKGKIFLTEEGKIFLEYVKRILEQEKELEKAIEDMKGLKRGTLRLGMPKTFAYFSMPLLMEKFHMEYPDIRIQVDEGSSAELMTGLLNRNNEIVFLGKFEDHPDINLIPIAKLKLKLIMKPSHRLAESSGISLKQLAEEPLVIREKGSTSRKLVLDMFEQNGLSPNIILESAGAENIIKIVLAGEYLSFLVEYAVDSEIEKQELASIPIEGHDLHIEICIAFLKEISLSGPAKAYLRLLFKNMSESGRYPLVAEMDPKDLPFE